MITPKEIKKHFTRASECPYASHFSANDVDHQQYAFQSREGLVSLWLRQDRLFSSVCKDINGLLSPSRMFQVSMH